MEILSMLSDHALREELERHLLSDHLLVPVTNRASESICKRAVRLNNALKVLELIEEEGVSPEMIGKALSGLDQREV